MKAFFQSLFCLLCIGLACMRLQAQTPTQVIVANGGIFGPSNMARIASWNLATGGYTVFDSIPARSVQHVLIHNRNAFVCVDSFVVRYDLDNLQRRAIAMIKGARQTAVWEDKLIVAKGYDAVGSYVEVRNMDDLSPAFSVSGISGECEGIVVKNDTAYVAEPLFFAALSGKLAVISLQDQVLDREIALDSNGRLIKNLYLHEDRIFSVNQISYFGAYGVISEYPIGAALDSVTHHRVDVPTSQGAGIYGDKLYATFGGGIGGFDLNSGLLVDSNIVAGYWAATVLDSVNQRFYVTETDYATYGKLYSYSWAGVRLDSVTIGISPEAIAVDYNVVTEAKPKAERPVAIRTFPQPCREFVNLDLRGLQAVGVEVEVMDIAGKLLKKEPVSGNRIVSMTTSDLLAGTYILRVHAGGKAWTSRLIKVN
jgi:hypothetical protein